jgi:sulfotransferase
MDRQYHFIAGLPRSGSTLLSAILSQNPRFHASMMSPVHKMSMGLINSWSAGNEIAPLVNKQQKRRIIKALFNQYHGQGKEVTFDSNRGWAEKLPLIHDLYPDAKVICCVRNIAWILDSFEKLYQQDPYEQTRLFTNDNDRSSVYSRVRALAGSNRVVGYSAQALKQAFYSQLSDKLIIVEFDALVKEPKQTIEKLYKMLGEQQFEHDFNNVGAKHQAFDDNLGVPGLHTVKNSIEYHPRDSILPPDLFKEYSGSNFWLLPNGSKAKFIKF